LGAITKLKKIPTIKDRKGEGKLLSKNPTAGTAGLLWKQIGDRK